MPKDFLHKSPGNCHSPGLYSSILVYFLFLQTRIYTSYMLWFLSCSTQLHPHPWIRCCPAQNRFSVYVSQINEYKNEWSNNAWLQAVLLLPKFSQPPLSRPDCEEAKPCRGTQLSCLRSPAARQTCKRRSQWTIPSKPTPGVMASLLVFRAEFSDIMAQNTVTLAITCLNSRASKSVRIIKCSWKPLSFGGSLQSVTGL